jgi:hypothetical protein
MNDSWREAKSLQVLESEIQDQFPGTTTWEIGDKAHQGTWSDHNKNKSGVVCGKDILGDHGLPLQKFVDYITAHPHPNLRYVIFNHKIYERSNGFEPEDYHGKSGHEEHAHVSVGNGPDGRSTKGYDDTSSWHLADMDTKPSQPSKPSKPTTPNNDEEYDMPTQRRGAKGLYVRILQALLVAWGFKVTIDGIFGAQTERQLRAFQAKHAKPVDGIAGSITWGKLLGQ